MPMAIRQDDTIGGSFIALSGTREARGGWRLTLVCCVQEGLIASWGRREGNEPNIGIIRNAIFLSHFLFRGVAEVERSPGCPLWPRDAKSC